MKHIFFVIAILVVSVFTTACINNFAIQELNTNAKKYLKSGDIDSAICRLKSSLELDNQVWETHYNLAIAYLSNKNFDEAEKEFKETISLNPDLADVYYSLAISQEEQATLLQNPKEETTKDEEDDEENANEEETANKPLDEETKLAVIAKLNEAKTNYNIFIQKATSQEEIDKVKEKIESIDRDIEKIEIGEQE